MVIIVKSIYLIRSVFSKVNKRLLVFNRIIKATYDNFVNYDSFLLNILGFVLDYLIMLLISL
ncbi:unnamed protein product [Arabidopsis halleri]